MRKRVKALATNTLYARPGSIFDEIKLAEKSLVQTDMNVISLAPTGESETTFK